jgi:hypothetical protein
LQAQDYRIQYDSIVRIFVLPKSHTPHTLVVISLDPPIRKGQTFYPHILVQLPTEEDMTVDLEITEEQFTEKNEKVPSASILGLYFPFPNHQLPPSYSSLAVSHPISQTKGNFLLSQTG